MGAFSFVVCLVFVTSDEVQNIFFIFMKEEFKWRTMNKGNVKGNQRLKHLTDDCPVFWPRQGCQRLKQNNVIQNCLAHRRDSYARQSVPETIRETAVPRTAECEKGAADRADYRSRWSDCQNPKLVDGKIANENLFPPTARVSAEARDENQWGAHDVCEFSR